jgi:hypothetical protein
VSLLSTAVFALLVALQVDVRSATNCPSTEDISARLAPLLPVPDHGAVGMRDRANVQLIAIREDGSTEMRIELFSADGVRLGERSVSSRGNCTQLAETVAAVLAAWESEPSPAATSPLSVTDAVPAITEPQRELVVQPSGAQSHGRGPFRGTVGIGGGVAVLGGVAGALKLAVESGAATSHWQLALDGSMESSRTISLAGGQVDWRHSTAGLGLGWRSLGGKLIFSADAGATVGWATLASRGYATGSRVQESFEYGLAAGLRLGRQWGRWQLWAEARPRWWIQGQRLRVTNSRLTADVSALDLVLCVGASVAAFP